MIIIADTIHDLVNNLKQLARGAARADNGDSIGVEFGTVKKVSPLVVDMGQYTVEGDLLVLSGYVKWKQGLSSTNDQRLRTGDALLMLDMGGEMWVAVDTVEVED